MVDGRPEPSPAADSRDTVRERRYQAIFESAVDFAIITTDCQGLVTDWNTGAGRVLGWSASEMDGQPVDRIFTPEDLMAGRPAQEQRQALQTGRAADERWHLRSDGSRFWASGELMPLRDHEGAHIGFLKIMRDRTEQRAAAEKQRAHNAFLHSVLAASGDCIKVLDLDGRLIFMNEGGQQIMQVSDFNAIEGCPWPDFWPDAGATDARAAVAAAKAGGKGQFQGFAPTMAGTPRWWDVQVSPMPGADGRPERLLSVSRDVTAMHHAEEALRESEAYWRSLFQKLQEGFVRGELVRDAAGQVTDWRYLDVNAAWSELVGIPHATASGRTVRELFPHSKDDWVGEMAAVVETGRPATYTRQVGAVGRWYDAHAFALGQDRFAMLFLDVTAHKQADARHTALLNLNDRLRDVEDVAEMSFAATEVLGLMLGVDRAGYATLLPDGATIAVDRNWTGPGVASITGLHWMRDYGSTIEDLRQGRIVSIDDAATDRRTRQDAGALDSIGARGLVNLPLIEHGRLVALFFVHSARPRAWTAEELGFMRNVAERTRSAIERRRAEQNLRSLAASLERQVAERTADRNCLWELSRDIMLRCDFTGAITAVNPAWTEMLGWSEAELVGATVLDFIHPDDTDRTAAELRGSSLGHFPPRLENRYRCKDGGYRWIDWSTRVADGMINAVGRDFTADKERAQAMAQMEEQLHQSQKMEAVGQLTGGLAHDFNNLLTGISGSLELIATRVAQGRAEEVGRYITAAQGAAKRAAALTHRLLAFARRQTLDPQAVDLNGLILGMEELLRRTVGVGIAVETTLPDRLWNILADQSQLENALLNLCINARDAMPGGGRLRIETANIRLDEQAAHDPDLRPGQYISLCVTDNGTGMTPDVIARAFDPFFTTKPIGQGTGLGLSMIYGFARQSGGQVRIRSEPGQGTAVCIHLPRHQATADGAEILVSAFRGNDAGS